jgi:hypothetical protein
MTTRFYDLPASNSETEYSILHSKTDIALNKKETKIKLIHLTVGEVKTMSVFIIASNDVDFVLEFIALVCTVNV